MRYLVTWTIDSDAPSAIEAAQEALATMRRADSIATVFTVANRDNGHIEDVDLSRLCPSCELFEINPNEERPTVCLCGAPVN